jgi:glutamate-1-semialdehyde 2,1-aminomutase
MVPCAEMTRFGKNGSDATAGAVRVARAYTGRDHVAVCGYHGWQDWYIGSTARCAGVPESTRALTHPFTYNRIDSLERIFSEFPGGVAAVIMEPMNVAEPEPGFLESVRDLAHRRGALLIFDETITGFRYANGGAQEYFGVTPDLATFGKGLANGYPLSAVSGRAEIMRLMEEVFFSFTFGGETLSLAASLATMRKLLREPVTKAMWERGNELTSGLRERIARHGAADLLENAAYPQLHVKTLFLQEMFARGILTLATHNMSFAHSAADVRQLLDAYDEVIPILQDAVENRTLAQRLRCEPLAPLFKVR